MESFKDTCMTRCIIFCGCDETKVRKLNHKEYLVMKPINK